MSPVAAPGLFIVHRRLLTMLVVMTGLSVLAFAGGALSSDVFLTHFTEVLLFSTPAFVAVIVSLVAASFSPPLLGGRLLLSLGLVLVVLLYGFLSTGRVWGVFGHPPLISIVLAVSTLIFLILIVGRRHLQLMLIAPLTASVVVIFAAAHSVRVGIWGEGESVRLLVATFIFGLTVSAQFTYRYFFQLWAGASPLRSVAESINIGLGSVLLLVLVYALQLWVMPPAHIFWPMVPLLGGCAFLLSGTVLALMEGDFRLGRREIIRQKSAWEWWQKTSARLTFPGARAGLAIAVIAGALCVLLVPHHRLIGMSIGAIPLLFALVLVAASVIICCLSFRVALMTCSVFLLSDLFTSVILGSLPIAPFELVVVRTVLITLIAGAGLAWRQSIIRGVHRRARLGLAVTTGIIPFVAISSLIVIAMAAFAEAARFMPSMAGQSALFSAMALRFGLEAVFAILLQPLAMTVLDRVRIV